MSVHVLVCVNEELVIAVSPVKIARATLHMDIKGVANEKDIFSGSVDIGLTKSLLKKLKLENPELLKV